MSTATKRGRELYFICQFLLIVVAILAAIAISPQTLSIFFKPADTTLRLGGTQALGSLLRQHKATLANIRNGRDTIKLKALNLPHDLIDQPSQKRIPQFIALILPHAIQSNNDILTQRKKLIRYLLDQKRDISISPDRKAWLNHLAADYSLPGATARELLSRIDIVPISLIIAQAILESGWGTSRFAQQGNGLYGQHLAHNSKGKYILSRHGNVKVAAFDSILGATKSYMHNLNTSRAYDSFRDMRENMRNQRRTPHGYTLAGGLLHYSEKGADYIDDIRHIIKRYRLEKLENTTIDRTMAPIVIRFTTEENIESAHTLTFHGKGSIFTL